MSNKKPTEPRVHQGVNPGAVCPLSKVAAGTVVCIKQLAVSADEADRLREMGLAERRQIKLVSHRPNYICQVAGSQLWLSKDLADNIWVEPVKSGIVTDKNVG